MAENETRKINDSESVTFARLALALANDYECVYYLNSKTNNYVEYGASGVDKKLRILSQGEDFFADTIVNCKKLVYEEDQDMFLRTFHKEKLLEAVNNGGSFTLDYRLVIKGVPRFYNLKTIRGTGSDDDYIIIGVRNVDAQVRRENEANAELETYSHIAKALASRYEVIYYINVDDFSFIEYSSSEEYAKLGVSKQGSDFFSSAKDDIKNFIYPEDCARILEELDRERFMLNIEANGSLTLTYRQLLGDRTQYVSMMAVKPKNDPHHVVIGVVNIDADKRREVAYREALGNAIEVANHDSLTSVRNKHAYSAIEDEMDEKILNGNVRDFAIAIFDVNGLKDINDQLGHVAGDEFIKSACEIICHTFKHSPVFRVGGDEFAVILSGSDYKDRGVLMGRIESIVKENKRTRLVTVAGGISSFDPKTDRCVRDVFERADAAMYENKKMFKTSVH
ncbi:MAG: GGDEF domain-containing protein [Ruminiclostridium sp.]|nr:GGDEF domain-containing protein [Ruminiclostridium sp.]